MIASIDPGISGSGLAIFDQDKLVFARYIPNTQNKTIPLHLRVRTMGMLLVDQIQRYPHNTIVTECPQIYPNKTAKGSDPTHDLIPLAQIGAIVAGKLSNCCWEQVYPKEWKGQVDKLPMNKRVLARLDEEEREKIDWATTASLDHNILDAIGIGLHYLNRLGKVRAIARG
jgi:hypothetical protein